MIDLKHEIERELSRMNPPDLWDRIRAEASTGDALGLAVAPHKRRTAPWLAIAAVIVVATLIAAAALTNDEDPVQTGPASEQPVPDPQLLPQFFEFAEAPTSGGIGVPPGGGLTQPAGGGLGGSTLTLSVTETGGEMTGEARITDFDFLGNPPHTVTIEIECSETDATDVVLGGKVTTSSGKPRVGEWIALLIRRGNSATVWWASDLASCGELLDAVPYPRPDDRFVDVVPSQSPTTVPRLDIADFEDGSEIRVGNVMVTVRCTGSRSETGHDLTNRDLILGGAVTANPDRVAMVDEVNVAEGALLALIIRQDGSGEQRATLYHPALWYRSEAENHTGSCEELVGSVPDNLDGGFFHEIEGGYDLEPTTTD